MDTHESPANSEIALAAAREMRRFDPTLTDDQIEAIARRIVRARAAAKLLNSTHPPLANADEPVTRFVLGEPGRHP